MDPDAIEGTVRGALRSVPGYFPVEIDEPGRTGALVWSALSAAIARDGEAHMSRRAAVVGGNRIPFARQYGAYARESNHDLLTAALNGLVTRFGLEGERLGEVVAGAVLKHSRDFNLTREAVLGSALAGTTPAYDVQQACGTGLEATLLVANKIALRQIEAGIAGGVDSSSDAPIALDDGLRRVLLSASAAKSAAGRATALLGLRPQHVRPEIPRNREPRTGLSMGEHQALTTAAWAVSRERQDELALASHHALGAAYERGFFSDQLTTHRGMLRDSALRADTNMDKLAGLRPVFGGPEGTMTAGNSTGLTDGAATVLLATEDWAAKRDLAVLAHLVDAEVAAVDYVKGNPREDGLLMAGVYAVPRLLDRLGLSLQDFEFYEIHEAFASTVLVQLDAWEDDAFCRDRLEMPTLGPIDRTRLNVAGSSLATGHPFGATGARIVATLAKLLSEKGSGRGLISICAAGGQGVAAVLEAA